MSTPPAGLPPITGHAHELRFYLRDGGEFDVGCAHCRLRATFVDTAALDGIAAWAMMNGWVAPGPP